MTMRAEHFEVCVRNGVEIPLSLGSARCENATFYSFFGLTDGREHIAIKLGHLKEGQVPLVRLHSECLTGDVFGSLKCDCGNQLSEALDRIHGEGGYLLYLRQEGRGIGLYSKLDAYRLQDDGSDTFLANRQLGFADDLRSYEDAARMLLALGVSKVKLLTNNPDKVAQLQSAGVRVDNRISTTVFCNQHNLKYLETKRVAAGHDISIALRR